MKRILLAALVLWPLAMVAQTPREEYEAWRQQAKGEYAVFKEQQIADYRAFRQQANAEYAAFVEQAWRNIRPQPAQHQPTEPKPQLPPTAPQGEAPSTTPMPHEAVAPLPKPKPVDDTPIVEPDQPVLATFSLNFYGTPLSLRQPTEAVPTLASTRRKPIAEAWKQLSDGRMDAPLADCQKDKQRLRLGDWGYVRLIAMVAERLADRRHNESVLLQHWLLAQSGYCSRLAVSGQGQLQLWMPFDALVYDHPYIELEGVPYFLITDNDSSDNELQVLPHGFHGEQVASLRMVQQPLLSQRTGRTRQLLSKRGMQASVAVNSNLIAYYADYPRVAGSWDLYASASLCAETKRQLYPSLRRQMGDGDKVQQAERLLEWVQTAFTYRTDEEQFGGERSLFADETLYYPYCDCEDRSILFATLIRDLLELDVVLLHFPGHLATAVAFPNPPDGDFLDIEGRRFTVCDPTYIGAPVGMAMPDCRKQTAEVYAW